MCTDSKRVGLRWFHLACAMLVGLIMACDSDSPEPGPAVELRTMEPMEADLVHTSNALAIDLARVVQSRDKASNIFISPFNMSMSLGILLNGASEESRAELLQSIGLSQYNSTEINKAFSEIRGMFEVIDPAVSVRMVNGLWSHLDYRFGSTFTSKVMAYYDAEVRELDFTRELSLRVINRWATFKSDGNLPEMIGTIDPDAGFLYTGGSVLKGAWSHAFDPDLSKEGLFYPGSKKPVKVSMIQSASMPVRYFKGDDISLVELDYGRGYYCLSVLVPGKDHSVDDVMKGLQMEDFNAMVQGADSLYMDLSMPRFQIDYCSSQVGDIWHPQGMQKIFGKKLVTDPMFEGEAPADRSSLHFRALMSNDVHGSFGASASRYSVLTDDHIPRLVIDRPFLFFVRERHTNTLLFFGLLRDPRL